ncbi:MAG TPA: MBL fold metallo-hydrolase, partial [Conexibacter sp.]|nr:MBL fold metallo-hydrolase [Conexibacter sp.]
MTGLPSLPLGRLSLTVFGPGFGESSMIGVPHGEWIVLDSLIDPSTGANPALELLREHDARPTIVVLTHPHDDHAAGFTASSNRRDVDSSAAYLPASGRRRILWLIP